MATYAHRLKEAREHAKISQPELARRLDVKQQAISYLENPKSAARGSKYTAAIARECGVNADWLASGRGSMLDGIEHTRAEQLRATYDALSDEAKQVAIAWSNLSPDMQASTREILFMLATAEKRYPWLRRGRPKGESYADYERRMEQNFTAMVALSKQRKTGTDR